MTTEITTSAGPVPPPPTYAQQCREQIAELRRELDHARQALKTAARGAILVDGNTLVFMLLTTKLLPTDEGTQKAVKLLRKRMETTLVRLEIERGRLTIADPTGKWSRALDVDAATAPAAPMEAAPVAVQPAPVPVPALPAPPAPEATDQELCDLCTALAEQPLTTRAACLAWLREEGERRKLAKQAQASAPGLRLVYSAPKGAGVRQPQPTRRGPVRAGRGGKVVRKGKATAKVPAHRRRAVADEWDW